MCTCMHKNKPVITTCLRVYTYMYISIPGLFMYSLDHWCVKHTMYTWICGGTCNWLSLVWLLVACCPDQQGRQEEAETLGGIQEIVSGFSGQLAFHDYNICGSWFAPCRLRCTDDALVTIAASVDSVIRLADLRSTWCKSMCHVVQYLFIAMHLVWLLYMCIQYVCILLRLIKTCNSIKITST